MRSRELAAIVFLSTLGSTGLLAGEPACRVTVRDLSGDGIEEIVLENDLIRVTGTRRNGVLHSVKLFGSDENILAPYLPDSVVAGGGWLPMHNAADMVNGRAYYRIAKAGVSQDGQTAEATMVLQDDDHVYREITARIRANTCRVELELALTNRGRVEVKARPYSHHQFTFKKQKWVPLAYEDPLLPGDFIVPTDAGVLRLNFWHIHPPFRSSGMGWASRKETLGNYEHFHKYVRKCLIMPDLGIPGETLTDGWMCWQLQRYAWKRKFIGQSLAVINPSWVKFDGLSAWTDNKVLWVTNDGPEVALAPGERVSASFYCVGSQGLRNIKRADPLFTYEVEPAIAIEGDTVRLRGKFACCYEGELRFLIDPGNGREPRVVHSLTNQPDVPLALEVNKQMPGARGQLVVEVVDPKAKTKVAELREGRLIEHWRPAGVPSLPSQRPPLHGDVAYHEGELARAVALVKARNFMIPAGGCAEEVRKLAGGVGTRLGLSTNPTGQNKWAVGFRDRDLVLIGGPSDNWLAGRLEQVTEAVSANWPGPGKGLIRVFETCEAFDGRTVVLVAGSDLAGTQKAADLLIERAGPAAPPTKGFAVWAANPMDKVLPGARNREDRSVLRIAAGRNEYQPGKIAITAWEDLADLEVEVGPLAGPNGAQLPAPRVAMVNLFEFKNLHTVPDELHERPAERIEAGQTRCVWLDFHVPVDAAPGEYTGEARITLGGRTKRMPIQFTVWAFALPERNPLRVVAVGQPLLGGWGYVGRKGALVQPDGSIRDEAWEGIRLFLRDCHRLGLNCFRPRPMAIRFVRWRLQPDGNVEFDFSVFDQLMELATEEGYDQLFLLGYVWPGRDERDDLKFGLGHGPVLDTKGQVVKNSKLSRDPDLNRTYCRALVAHLRDKGWLDRSFLTVLDEEGKWAWYRRVAEPFHELGLRTHQFLTNATADIQFVEDMLDLYIISNRKFPDGQYDEMMDMDYYRELKKRGKIVGWYNCTWDKHHQGTLAMWRQLGWDAWRFGCEVFGQYTFLVNPKLSKETGTYGFNSVWSIIYPGDESSSYRVRSSIRAEAFRESIEEYQYCWLLDQKIRQARATGRDVAEIERGFARVLRRVARVQSNVVLDEARQWVAEKLCEEW